MIVIIKLVLELNYKKYIFTNNEILVGFDWCLKDEFVQYNTVQ